MYILERTNVHEQLSGDPPDTLNLLIINAVSFNTLVDSLYDIFDHPRDLLKDIRQLGGTERAYL